MDELNTKNSNGGDTGPSNSMAGGFFVALGLLGGAILGVAVGQPSAGMIGGLVLGGIIAIAIWFFDSRK